MLSIMAERKIQKEERQRERYRKKRDREKDTERREKERKIQKEEREKRYRQTDFNSWVSSQLGSNVIKLFMPVIYECS